MNILITGNTGRLGSELTKVLGEDHHIMGLTRGPNHTDCEVLRGSITNSVALYSLLNRHQPDMIINCAAMSSVDGCEMLPRVAYEVNAWPLITLSSWCNTNRCKLVHISSNYVFGDCQMSARSTRGYDSCSPVNIYGSSKLLSEFIIETNMNNGYCIIRTANLYGDKGASFPRKLYNRLIDYDKGPIMQIDPVMWMNPTYIPTLAEAMNEFLYNYMMGEKPIGIRVHMAGHGIPATTFCKKIIEVLGADGVEIGTDYCARTRRDVDGVIIAARPSVRLINDYTVGNSIVEELAKWRDSAGLALEVG